MTETKKATTTTTPKPDYTAWSVYKKLAFARNMVQSGGMKKSGMHRHTTKTGQRVEYTYFELADFLPQANKAFNEVGLCSAFRIVRNEGGAQIAVLDVVNADKPEEQIHFMSETANVEMTTPIQSLGALHTYMRRYLWLEAMEIVENDMVDAPETEVETQKEKPKRGSVNDTPPTVNPITDRQKTVLEKYAGTENMQKALDFYGADSVDDLTAEQASNTIKAFLKREAE